MVVAVVVLRVVVLTLGNFGRFALAVGTNLEYFKVVVGLGGYVTFSGTIHQDYQNSGQILQLLNNFVE